MPFPTPGGLPNPGNKPTSPASPALVGGFFYHLRHLGSPITNNYSAIKKKKYETMPFAVTWMDLETVILSEVSQRKTNILTLLSGI